MALAEGHSHTIALDQSALLEVLEAPKAAIPRLWGGSFFPVAAGMQAAGGPSRCSCDYGGLPARHLDSQG
jgi:hypothetical protein